MHRHPAQQGRKNVAPWRRPGKGGHASLVAPVGAKEVGTTGLSHQHDYVGRAISCPAEECGNRRMGEWENERMGEWENERVGRHSVTYDEGWVRQGGLSRSRTSFAPTGAGEDTWPFPPGSRHGATFFRPYRGRYLRPVCLPLA